MQGGWINIYGRRVWKYVRRNQVSFLNVIVSFEEIDRVIRIRRRASFRSKRIIYATRPTVLFQLGTEKNESNNEPFCPPLGFHELAFLFW